MIGWVKTEIPFLMGLVQAVLAVVIAFGVNLTQDQTAAVLGLAAVILAVVTRTQVSPKQTGQ